ncbi:MAG TPA: hypothetical protein VGY76_06770 [Solirubrobacteraceae bacterium]|nr:hypothetical protein [Solirubrobacteraceae bacterium]
MYRSSLQYGKLDAMMSAEAPSNEEQSAATAYHIELRQFPHNLCSFNLTEQELYATIVEPWAREQWIELGERKWNPHQAKLTVLEGPHLPVEQLSMGRGWRSAQRTGREVTERLLAAVKTGRETGVQAAPASIADASQAQAAALAREEGLLADSLGLELLAQLASGPVSLRHAWELVVARHPDRGVGNCLALAERAVASLLASNLIVLIRANGLGDTQRQVDEAELPTVLQAIESWTAEIVGIARR